MAKYLILIYGDEQRWAAMSPAEQQAHDAAHRAFRAAAGPAVVGGEQLDGSATATAMRAGDGGLTVTDGPFLETKEVLGGVFVIEARDLDQAIAIAKLTPTVDGGVEVVPLIDFQVL